MIKRLLFCSLVGGTLTACQREADIQPNVSSLAGEVAGTYHTNVYLDPSCVAIPADKMPYAQLKAESDSSVTLVYTTLYPAKASQSVEHISLHRQSDGVQLRVADLNMGTLQTDRIFTNTGMEKQGKRLQVIVSKNSANPVYFSGFR